MDRSSVSERGSKDINLKIRIIMAHNWKQLTEMKLMHSLKKGSKVKKNRKTELNIN